MGKVRQPLIQYDGRNLVSSHGNHDPVRICLHDTESHDAPGVADLAGVASYWHGSGTGYGSHLGIDADGNTGRYVDDREIAWHVGGHNTGSLGIEQIGMASFSKTTWLKRKKQLDKVAKWIAYWSKTYNIPITRSIERGVFTHAMWSAASPLSDHTDPGSGYPLTYVMFRARQYKKTGW